MKPIWISRNATQMPRNCRRALMRSSVEEMVLLWPLKMESFLQSHIDQQTGMKIERLETVWLLHQKNPSWTEEKHRWGKSRWRERSYQICLDAWHWKNVWRLVSPSAKHKAQRLGPFQPRFCRLSQERFLLWKRSHEKKVILRGHGAFQKERGKKGRVGWASMSKRVV